MKETSIDFGRLLAYAFPGAVALWGAAALNDDVRRMFADAYSGDHALGALTGLVVLAIVAGMILSIVRYAVIDRTYAWDLRRFALLRRLPAHYGSIKRVEPNYSALASKESLAAYQEAKEDDKRVHQFYGNLMVALLICAVVRVGDWWLERVFFLALAMLLYTGARSSYKRFMEAVEGLNALGAGPLPHGPSPLPTKGAGS